MRVAAVAAVAAAETLASNKTISASQPLKYLKDAATQAESNLGSLACQ